MKNKIAVIAILFFSFFACTDLNESLYSGIDRNNFYNNRTEVTAAILRVYEHGSWFYRNFDMFTLEELTADQLVITQKGGHWYDQGKFIRFHRHEWTSEEPELYGTWRGAWIGISLSNTLLDELANIDYEAIPGGLTDEDQQWHLAEMRVLRATYYYHLLNLWGTVPISEAAHGTPPDPSSRQEVYDWVTQDLKNAAQYLPSVTYREARGRLNQGAAMHLLARYYLNSEAWFGVPRYDEVEQITRDIINGVYGNFQLDDTFYGPFAYNNAETSNEIIFGFPRERAFVADTDMYNRFYHYQAPQIFASAGQPWNGMHLQPSLKPPVSGQDYTPRASHPRFMPHEHYNPDALEQYQWEPGIGTPFAHYHDDDLRKQTYNFEGEPGVGNKNFDVIEGMFLHGVIDSPITGILAMGTEEYRNHPLVHVDFVARAAEGASASAVANGEENSGVRLVKYPIYPDNFSGALNSDHVEYRLAETYYMLAESLIRQGKPGAAEYINAVKQRNFEDYGPHAYSDSDLDLVEMLAEWGREFIGEKRRRTDLIRFGKYGTEWWDKSGSAEFRQLFPYPSRVLNTNPNLEQNPGY